MIILNHGISACTRQNFLTTVLLIIALDSVPLFLLMATTHAHYLMAPIPDLKRVNVKAEDLITQIQEIHITIANHLQETTAKHLQETSAKAVFGSM